VDYLIKWAKRCAAFILFCLLITILWQSVEFVMLGHINPNEVDTVMTFLWSGSIVYAIDDNL
jgi:3-hydroxyacyl-CoA dehydrogenase